VLVEDRLDDTANSKRQQQCQGKHHARMPQREPKSDRQGAVAAPHQPPRGVVDRRDVIGVEGMPHAQHISGKPDADAEHLRAVTQMLRDDDGKQDGPADNVQGRDASHHAEQRSPSPNLGAEA
jgi:hypothetical protein